MSIFDYQAAIKITFDKPIVTDPEIVTGTEYYKKLLSYSEPETINMFCSSYYSGNPASQAYNGNLTDRWCSNGGYPCHIGRDFGSEISLAKIAFYVNSYIPNAYQLQGSNDGVNYTTLTSGNFVNSVGWKEVTFTQSTYRYWRLYITSGHDATYACIYEMLFYDIRNTYSTAGWVVTGSEYAYQPEGVELSGPYTVRKVTKTEDDMSVILWLDMFDRMRDPAGLVTVTYDKLLGNLIGPYSAQVESFSVQFSTANIIPYSNPHDRDNLSALANMTVSVMEVAYKYIPAESNTFLIADQDNPYMDEHLSAQANMTVVVTKVGDQPL